MTRFLPIAIIEFAVSLMFLAAGHALQSQVPIPGIGGNPMVEEGEMRCTGDEITWVSNSTDVLNGATYSWTFGSGASPASATGPGPFVVQYQGSGLQTVVLEVNNNNGEGPAFDTLNFELLDPFGNLPLLELLSTDYESAWANGQTHWLQCGVFPPGDLTIQMPAAGGLEFDVDWGDGSPNWEGASNDQASHMYASGLFELQVDLHDPASGCSTSQTYIVQNNVTPELTLSTPQLEACVGIPFQFDVATGGALVEATMNFSDGTDSTFVLQSAASLSHAFAQGSCDGAQGIQGAEVSISATDVCSGVSLPLLVLDSLQVLDVPEAAIASTGCPGCAGTPVDLADVTPWCGSGHSRIWQFSGAIPFVLEAGDVGNTNGAELEAYEVSNWDGGSENISVVANAPGMFEAWLIVGNACGVDSVQHICAMLPGDPILPDSLTSNGGVMEICNGSTFGPWEIDTGYPNDTIYWSVSVPNGVSGLQSANGWGVSPMAFPEVILTNSAFSPKTVQFQFHRNCGLPAEQLAVKVYPDAAIYLGPPAAPDTICSGVPLFMLVNATAHNVYIEWEINDDTPVVGGADGNGPGVFDVLLNTSDTVQHITYTFTTPMAVCPADTLVHELTVIPQFQLQSMEEEWVACPGDSLVILDYATTTSGVTYDWYTTGDPIGTDSSGVGILPGFLAVNEEQQTMSGVLHLAAHLQGCVNEIEIEIDVLPIPELSLSGVENMECSNAPLAWQVESGVEGLEVAWLPQGNASIAGMTSGQATVPFVLMDTLINGGGLPDTLVYVFSTPLHGCPSEPFEVEVLVGPNLALMVMDSIHVCDGTLIELPNWGLALDSVSYGWQIGSGGGFGLASEGDSLLLGWEAISDSVNAVSEGWVVLLTEAYSCLDSSVFHVAVEPIPQLSINGWDTLICSGVPLDAQVLSTVSWTNVVLSAAAPQQISGHGLTPGLALTDTLINLGADVATAEYAFWVMNSFCPSDTLEAAVAVRPSIDMPEVDSSAWCVGDEVDLLDFMTEAAEASYVWVNNNENIGLGSTGADEIPVWTATNDAPESEVAVIEVVSALEDCPSDTMHFHVVVYPLPILAGNVGPNGGLDCQTGLAFIEGFSSTGFGEFSFSGPSIVEAGGALAVVDAVGEYWLEFIDVPTGCHAFDTLEVFASEPIEISNTSVDSIYCFGINDGAIHLEVSEEQDLLFAWTPSVSVTSEALDLGPGSYQVLVSNLSNCVDTVRFELESPEQIQVEVIDSSPSICLLSSGYIEVAATGGLGGYTYSWDGTMGPILSGIDAGVYQVNVVDASGCEVEEAFPIGCADELPIPVSHLVTPNGDGKNDTWILEDLHLYPDHRVAVFNRWGAKVYEAGPYLNDWKGTWEAGGGNGQPLPSATYYYLFDPGADWILPFRGYIEIQNEAP